MNIVSTASLWLYTTSNKLLVVKAGRQTLKPTRMQCCKTSNGFVIKLHIPDQNYY